MFSVSVNCLNHMKHIESNNTDGILDPCSYLDSAYLILFDPRYIIFRTPSAVITIFPYFRAGFILLLLLCNVYWSFAD
jgi:hypothetical protein